MSYFAVFLGAGLAAFLGVLQAMRFPPSRATLPWGEDLRASISVRGGAGRSRGTRGAGAGARWAKRGQARSFAKAAKFVTVPVLRRGGRPVRLAVRGVGAVGKAGTGTRFRKGGEIRNSPRFAAWWEIGAIGGAARLRGMRGRMLDYG